MRTTVIAILLVGCGGNGKSGIDAPPPPPPVDAAIDAPPVAPACASPTSGTNITLRRIGTVTGSAVLATAPEGDPRIFVIEQGGRIRIFDEQETLLPTPFIDLSDSLAAGGERGLLGLAFHPQYATNGTFFVFFTTATPNANVVARCQRSANDPNRADPTCTTVLSIPDFASNHNGGMIEFGADGFLYIGTGDGGGANDPQRTGQDLDNLLGKMLRIDVDNKLLGMEYGIPADNPFAQGGGLPEIYQLGLRNPWRWSFDRGTGDMYIGDVGQGQIEEIHVVRAGQQRGVNFGWSTFEGSLCFRPPACDMTGLTFPQDERPRSGGYAAIIGGQVYRGQCFPDLVGTYFYGDHSSSQYARGTLQANGTLTVEDIPRQGFPNNPSSFHADGRGEMIVTTTAGGVFRIEATP